VAEGKLFCGMSCSLVFAIFFGAGDMVGRVRVLVLGGGEEREWCTRFLAFMKERKDGKLMGWVTSEEL